MRFLPFALFFFIVILLFISGSAAGLYVIFTKYSGISNIWLLICGIPFGLIIFAFFVMFNLYSRFGRPLRQMFAAIDSVAEGNLTVRVPEDSSPQFGELIKRFNQMVGELERADQQRRNLTADIAHELRTPLHIIQGRLEGIQDGVFEANSKSIDEALEETRLLGRLVDDLQTLSLAEADQLPLHKSRFALADLFREAESTFSPQASRAGVALVAKLPSSRQQITADYGRLFQVLSNLITNALRYTPEDGTITLESKMDKEKGNVLLTISDTGEGIPPEDLPFIFDRFWRGERSRTRKGQVNSGLGLAIAKGLCPRPRRKNRS